MELPMHTNSNNDKGNGDYHYHVDHARLLGMSTKPCKTGVHALHHLLSAIACGRVTQQDLRKAFIAKKRRTTASRPHSSSATHRSVETKSRRSPTFQELELASGKVSHASRISEAEETSFVYSYREEIASFIRLDGILQRFHHTCDKYGRQLFRGNSAGEVFCRSLEAYCARCAVEDGPRMYPDISPAAQLAELMLDSNASTPHSCHGDFGGGDRSQQHAGGTFVFLYDEAKLFDSFRILSMKPSHVIHLCFWAASRLLLSQPLHRALDVSFFLLLLESVATSLNPRLNDLHSGGCVAEVTGAFTGSKLTVTVAERLAAAQYVKLAIAIPFLKWWSYLISELPSSEKRSGENKVGTKDGRVPSNKLCDPGSSFGCRDKKRALSVLRGRNGRRSRVAAWQSLLSLIVKKSDASDGVAATLRESDMLCSLVDSSWSSEGDLKWHGGIYSLPLNCCESEQSAESLLELASLVHANEHLVIQFVFVDPARIRQGMEQNEQLPCPFSSDHQGSNSAPAACRSIAVDHNIISSWLSWVLRRHMLLTANSTQ